MQMQLGKVLGSKYDDDGFLTVQVETFGTGTKSVGWFYLSNPHGLQMRPLDPDADGTACQVYYWYEGSQGYAMLANDPRTQNDVSIQLQKGETILHSPLGSAFLRMKADGSISLFTTDDNTTNGRSVYLILGPSGLAFNFPFGQFTFNANGFHLQHSGGARLDLGSLSGIPAPIGSLVSSYATLSAGMVHVEGSAVHCGSSDPVAGPPQPVALATALLTLATAVQAVLTALSVPGAFVSTSPGSPATPGPELLAAIGVAQAALVTAGTAIPSSSNSATGSIV